MSNAKIVVMLPYEYEDIPSNCQIIPMHDNWVSVALKENLKKWCESCPVMISAPTGRGKTTFTADIVKYCKNKTPAKKVLLLVNRVAIATQQKRELLAKLGSDWAKVQDMWAIEHTDDFDDVGLTVMTYQKFALHHSEMNLKAYNWVILDEAHYFIEDSAFNLSLDQIFWKIPKLFSHACRLYMTATPGKILPEICQAEKENIKRCRTCRFWPVCKTAGCLTLYEFPRDFDRVNLFYYRSLQEIIPLAERNPNDKFLIFTSRREYPADDVSKSYAQLLQKAGISVSYLDSFSKNTEDWNCICKEGSFDAQVLVCTSVLDCGVSLHDDRIKHIVVETTDKTQFLQMIGRKRLKMNENVNVYLRVPSAGKLNYRLIQVREKLSFISNAEQKIKDGHTDSLIFSAWNDESNERLVAHFFNYKGHGWCERKETAYQYLKWQEGTLKRILRMIDEFDDDSALPRLAHEWLEQEDGYDPTHWLDYDQKAETREKLIDYLENNVGKSFGKSDWVEFSEIVKSLCNGIKVFPKDMKRKLDYRAINQRLSSLEIPYITSYSEGTYIIRYKEENDNDTEQNV